MRQGRVFKRCSKCGAAAEQKRPDGTRETLKRCPKCGSDVTSWAYVVDVAAAGAKREQRRGGGFATKAEAVAAMNKLQAGKADGTHIDPSKLTVGEYLSQWLSAGCGGVRPWTLSGYRTVVDRHIVPALGGVPLQRLTRQAIKAFYAELGRTGFRRKSKLEGTGLSAKSIHNVHICLRAALNVAVEDGLLRENPATGALRPPSARQEMLTWTREELASFLEAIAEERDFALFRLAAWSGMRRGELLGLRWSDVKWQLGSLSVQQQLGLVDEDGTHGLTAPKTDHGRRAISLDAETLRVLEAQRQAQQFERNSWGSSYQDADLVFARPDGSPIRPDSVAGRFEQLVKRAGVKRIRFHDLRHTHGTLCLEAGIDIAVVSRRLGHADVGFTAKVYAHVTERLQRDAAAKLSAYLEPQLATG